MLPYSMQALNALNYLCQLLRIRIIKEFAQVRRGKVFIVYIFKIKVEFVHFENLFQIYPYCSEFIELIY